ncbi:MAG: DUF4157 domain-containing protein [Nitrococcus mobilis]|nr:DUF4157 domain-containing protein [Nitrococcus mobilis]
MPTKLKKDNKRTQWRRYALRNGVPSRIQVQAQAQIKSGFIPVSTGQLQRKCACGNHAIGRECAECGKQKLLGLQTKLKISEPGDSYEQEADRIAAQVMATPARLASGGTPPPIQRFSGEAVNWSDAMPDSVHQTLASPGRPLDPASRAFFEPRFGHDFSQVRVHTDAKAAESARAVNAQAYTIGRDVVFVAGQYAPANRDGQRLLAHELTHVVQQSALPHSSAVAQRQHEQGVDPDVVAEREYGSSGAPKAQKCGRPPRCPAGFCDPYRSEQLAEYYRSKKAWWLMAGISAAVDSRVVPLWREYLWGGSSPKDLSADFGKDFTNSPTTKRKTKFLYDELKKNLAAKPPSVALYSKTSLDIVSQIPQCHCGPR